MVVVRFKAYTPLYHIACAVSCLMQSVYYDSELDHGQINTCDSVRMCGSDVPARTLLLVEKRRTTDAPALLCSCFLICFFDYVSLFSCFFGHARNKVCRNSHVTRSIGKATLIQAKGRKSEQSSFMGIDTRLRHTVAWNGEVPLCLVDLVPRLPACQKRLGT